MLWGLRSWQALCLQGIFSKSSDLKDLRSKISSGLTKLIYSWPRPRPEVLPLPTVQRRTSLCRIWLSKSQRQMPESWSKLLGFLTLSRVKQSSNCSELKLTGVFKGLTYQMANLEASVHQNRPPLPYNTWERASVSRLEQQKGRDYPHAWCWLNCSHRVTDPEWRTDHRNSDRGNVLVTKANPNLSAAEGSRRAETGWEDLI